MFTDETGKACYQVAIFGTTNGITKEVTDFIGDRIVEQWNAHQSSGRGEAGEIIPCQSKTGQSDKQNVLSSIADKQEPAQSVEVEKLIKDTSDYLEMSEYDVRHLINHLVSRGIIQGGKG